MFALAVLQVVAAVEPEDGKKEASTLDEIWTWCGGATRKTPANTRPLYIRAEQSPPESQAPPE